MKSQTLMNVEHGFFIICLIVMALLIFLCLIRAIRGPRLTDRIVAGNMIGTMTIMSIGILSVLLEGSYMIDVCLIYAMISFIAVVVLSKVYMGVYRERKEAVEKGEKKC
ncbi:MAG: monovalent cation/H+ antiporter complex subunit F [Lachnospiraceae bacterium]|nr:monovalent cation/H+ antiporter complex subunit F [Lachnospiraceae bacterium]